jgi:hypothetical protein
MRHQENIKNAQHSKVGRVNLGARIAPFTSRKCQENDEMPDLRYWLIQDLYKKNAFTQISRNSINN